jgi:hypothetical protein
MDSAISSAAASGKLLPARDEVAPSSDDAQRSPPLLGTFVNARAAEHADLFVALADSYSA